MPTLGQRNYRRTSGWRTSILWWHQQYSKQTSDWVYRSGLSHDNQTSEKTEQIARKYSVR